MALDFFRREREFSSLDDSFPAPETSDYATCDAVHRVLAQLSPEDRCVLLLVDLEGLSMKELSMVLQAKESASKMRLLRARERFRKLYRALS